MNKPDLTLFQGFGRGAKKIIIRKGSKRCVIYTRVSGARQLEGLSIEFQIKDCIRYAESQGWEIVELFGGTNESAKTDDRAEFQRMLDYVKKHDIGWIVVHSLERFSRNENALLQSSQLRKKGVEIVAATNPIDTSNPSGRLQQKVMFIFGEHDNELRRMKCVRGTKEHLLRGEWCNMPPMGYSIVKTNGERKIVVNEKGRLIRKVFLWKANEGISSEEIRQRMAALGLKLSQQQVSKILHNPFYCGLLVHNMLEGQVVEGQQEKLISYELFLQANDVLQAKFTQGYTVCPENDELPLKRFLRCECCGKPMTGYAVRKKQKVSKKGYKMRPTPQYYYKCRTVACKANINARYFNSGFEQVVQHFSFDLGEDMQQLIREQMVVTYTELSKTQDDEKQLLEKTMKELEKTIEEVEEKYVRGKISEEMFEKYGSKYRKELAGTKEKYQDLAGASSNLHKCIEYAVTLSSKLSFLYSSSTYAMKQKLQFALFPQGITYNKKTGEVLTPRINPVLAGVARLARVSGTQKRGELSLDTKFTPLVEPGILRTPMIFISTLPTRLTR